MEPILSYFSNSRTLQILTECPSVMDLRRGVQFPFRHFFLTLARSCPSKHEWEMNTEFAILEIRCISFECYIWNNMMTLCVYVCVCVDGFRRLRSKEQYPPLHAAVPADDIMWPVGPNQGLENHTQDCRQFSCSFVMHVLLVAIIVDSGSC